MTNFPDIKLAYKIYDDLKFGAKIGCRGKFSNPSSASNAPSAYKDGPQVSDAIADWLHKGFAYGPIPLHEVPANAKFSGIMTKPKPNGSVRIILKLSAPLGASVNKGIDPSEFPTTMSSTTAWLRVLSSAGRNAKFYKIDWADAYKHVAVSQEDTELQWFSWAGKAFEELCLIFGCASSAGLFDRLAKVVLHIVLQKANFPCNMVVQHPNKQKPVKNTRLFGVFHTSDPSLSRDNSRAVEVIVDDLITGLGPSFYTVKT